MPKVRDVHYFTHEFTVCISVAYPAGIGGSQNKNADDSIFYGTRVQQ